MSDILTITLNPAVDLATSVDRVVAGPKLYCRSPRFDPGGGGVNVARAICKLGGRATALVAVGGAMGQTLLGLLAVEGVPTLPVDVGGETRQSLAVTDETTGEQLRFSLPGDSIAPDMAETLLSRIAEATPISGHVVLSGGVAPGLGDDFPQRIQAAVAQRTDRLIIDTSKGALERLIARPNLPALLLRIDHREAELAAGRTLAGIADSVDFAAGLVARGVARMIVTARGAEGSVMVTQNARFLCHAAPVEVRSKVGAGDSFVGAMTLALSRGDPPEQALRWGVAAASAAVETEGTALCDATRTQAIFDLCRVEAL